MSGGRPGESQRYFYPRSPCGERRWPGIAAWPSAYFYPRSPCGERRAATAAYSETQRFLSTLSLRRATAVPDLGKGYIGISIHALLAESDLMISLLVSTSC